MSPRERERRRRLASLGLVLTTAGAFIGADVNLWAGVALFALALTVELRAARPHLPHRTRKP